MSGSGVPAFDSGLQGKGGLLGWLQERFLLWMTCFLPVPGPFPSGCCYEQSGCGKGISACSPSPENGLEVSLFLDMVFGESKALKSCLTEAFPDQRYRTC
jgi:hypothetical protein